MRKIAAVLVALFACTALAQEYPVRAVRIVVPFAPGGGTDIVGRILAQQLSQRLGQSFVVDNRPAGSGIVGADLVAKANADGYTLLFAFSSLSSSAKLFSKLPYDPVRDLAAARRRAGVAAGEEHSRVHRPRQGKRRQAQLRLLRSRQLAAPRDRAPHVPDRRADA